MIAAAARLREVVLVRYLGISVVALCVDLLCFLALLELGTAAGAASAGAYSLGIAAHWLLSSRTVFGDAVAGAGTARTRQKALFVLSALVGLAITTALVSLAAALGADPRLAKLGAIGVSFTATWLLRERVVFRRA